MFAKGRRLLQHALPAGVALALAAQTGMAIGAEIRRDAVNGVPVILVTGQIEYGDERRFESVAIGMDRATVALAGPGGNLHAGIEIGKAIRARGFDTAAPGLCASACALAWLGGQKRLAHAEARVGFHGAWMERNGRSEVVSGGNALVGAYLNQLGFSQSAILYMTTAGPGEMTWLNPSDARREGISVVWKDSGGRAPVATNPVPSAPVREVSSASVADGPRDWSVFGEWVQVASRQRLEDAVPIAKGLERQGASVRVFRSDKGWYAVAIGPFAMGRGQDAREGLVGQGKASRDSLVTKGGRFASLAWGTPPRTPGAAQIYTGPGSLRDDD